MFRPLALLFLSLAIFAAAKDDPVVFKSDVAMTRVDAQVVDRSGRAITGLQVNDFVLRVDGKVTPIKNFASEDMPIDILLLLDVSGSMQPHVERIASAAREALNVLTDKDRVAIMVFDVRTRVRLRFSSSHSEVTMELNRVLRSEGFNRGTRITSAMLDAADYLRKEARPEARKAVVILTDDETQDEENEPRVESALARANAVLSFLQAPYEVPTGGGPLPGPRAGGGTWGGGGGGIPGGLGWPGGGGSPIGIGRGRVDPSHSAGTANIAADSGGDTMRVDEASALEDTLARLRQRYALHFYLPEGAKQEDRQTVRVELSQMARLRYPDAEIHYRRVFMQGGGTNEQSGPTEVTHARPAPDAHVDTAPSIEMTAPPKGRRAAVNEDSEPRVNTVDMDSDDTKTPDQQTPQAQPVSPPTKQTGWPRATPPQTAPTQPSQPN